MTLHSIAVAYIPTNTNTNTNTNAKVKIISGGQTGADLGGLQAGVHLGIPTGGWIPRGFRTEDGPAPHLKQLYNLKETHTTDYQLRTKLNVRESHITIWFGDPNSPGGQLTHRFARTYNKPSMTIDYQRYRVTSPLITAPEASGASYDDYIEKCAVEVTGFILYYYNMHETLQPNTTFTINIAGNRESTSPGIQDFTFKVLTTPTLDPKLTQK